MKLLKHLICLLFYFTTSFALGQDAQAPQADSQELHNNLLVAVAWKQTAAEYRALYYQGFNLARMRVELALANHTSASKPLAVVTDVDETLLLASDYWGYLINQGQDFFDDASWDRWLPENRAVASPGALEFLRFCESNNVEVFYVTNRNQGDATYQIAVANLQAWDFPYVDQQHLTVLRESSNKETVQQRIMQDYEVVVFLGDNLNDFRRKYYRSSVEQRLSLMQEDRERYGRDFILFPNPTDGHWIRAIFGDSEPPPSDRNRQVLKDAATREAWTP
ncbi:MAG: 5'-nucleotidase, lipoprotein e(P4) family [Proteobacteria bacterium]|nr:5'-nucleotidase, lipoprotein e(P4) family [Pseudomonadota bacterium]